MECEDLVASIGLLSDCEKVVPSEVVVDKDDEMLMLVFDEALGVGDDELKEFDMISDDYEINWHLRSVINPTSKDLKSRSAKVKNRRRAFMDKLMNDGKLLSKDSIRDREPYLHHEFALLMEKIQMEQQRLGVDEMYWVGYKRYKEEQEEQKEEEDEDDNEVEEGKHGDANVRVLVLGAGAI
nr:hypothetical protein [Tanacetum cinerariifolium]